MINNLCVFDFDGTLSPIVPDRNAAEMHDACRAMLTSLVALEHTRAAVLSSRMLEDVRRRASVPGVYLGGGSGAEWLLPEGMRTTLPSDRAKQLRHVRASVLAELQKLLQIEGIDIEDKQLTIAVHVRQVAPNYRRFILRQLEFLKFNFDLTIYPGPEAYELVLLPEIQKPSGLMTLCGLIGFDINKGFLLYAGDDAHDAEVMKLVVQHGGMAFTVGREPLVPGAAAVADPAALALAVLTLFRTNSLSSAPGIPL